MIGCNWLSMAAELGVWSVDLGSGRFENDARDRRIHGHHPQAPPKTLAEARPLIHPDDLPSLDAAFAASGRAGGSYKAEYRLAPVPGHAPCRPRALDCGQGTVVRRADGRPVRLLGVTRDITERKQAEARLQKSERALREMLGALPAADLHDGRGRAHHLLQSKRGRSLGGEAQAGRGSMVRSCALLSRRWQTDGLGRLSDRDCLERGAGSFEAKRRSSSGPTARAYRSSHIPLPCATVKAQSSAS